jgi:hypothetical protein
MHGRSADGRVGGVGARSPDRARTCLSRRAGARCRRSNRVPSCRAGPDRRGARASTGVGGLAEEPTRRVNRPASGVNDPEYAPDVQIRIYCAKKELFRPFGGRGNCCTRRRNHDSPGASWRDERRSRTQKGRHGPAQGLIRICDDTARRHVRAQMDPIGQALVDCRPAARFQPVATLCFRCAFGRMRGLLQEDGFPPVKKSVIRDRKRQWKWKRTLSGGPAADRFRRKEG